MYIVSLTGTRCLCVIVLSLFVRDISVVSKMVYVVFWAVQHATATARLAAMLKAKANVTLCARPVGFCRRRTTNVIVSRMLFW